MHFINRYNFSNYTQLRKVTLCCILKMYFLYLQKSHLQNVSVYVQKAL